MNPYFAFAVCRTLLFLGVKLREDLLAQTVYFEMKRRFPNEPKERLLRRVRHGVRRHQGLTRQSFEEAEMAEATLREKEKARVEAAREIQPTTKGGEMLSVFEAAYIQSRAPANEEEGLKIRSEFRSRMKASDEANALLKKLKKLDFNPASMPIRTTVKIETPHVETLPGLGEFHLDPGDIEVEFSFNPQPLPHPECEDFQVLAATWRFTDAEGYVWENKILYRANVFPGFVDEDMTQRGDCGEANPMPFVLTYHGWASATEAVRQAFRQHGLGKGMEADFKHFLINPGAITIGNEEFRLDMRYSGNCSDLAWLAEEQAFVVRLFNISTPHEEGGKEVPPFYFTIPPGALFPLTSLLSPWDWAAEIEEGLNIYEKRAETGTPQPGIRFVPKPHTAVNEEEGT